MDLATLLERTSQPHQHDMVTSSAHLVRVTCGNGESAFDFDHLHDAVTRFTVRVKFRTGGCISLYSDKRVVLVASIPDLQKRSPGFGRRTGSSGV